jgi:AcrR family transcriptional regulator
VIAKKGIEGASIGKVGKHMGVHPSLLIHYFGSKENMNIELIDSIMEGFRASDIWASLDELEDPRERFDEFLNILFGEALSKTVDDVVFYVLHYLSLRNRKMRDIWERAYDGFRDVVAAELKSLVKQGVIRVSDPEMAAELIISLREGVGFLGSFSDDNGPSEALRESAKEAVRNLMNMKTPRKTRSKARKKNR